jgi:hypothetical protein
LWSKTVAHSPSKDSRDNRANQLNRQHPAFYLSRGLAELDAESEAAKVREDQPDSRRHDESRGARAATNTRRTS